MLSGFYHVAFGKKIYDSIDTLQTDLDAWRDQYNNERGIRGDGVTAKPRRTPSSIHWNSPRKTHSSLTLPL